MLEGLLRNYETRNEVGRIRRRRVGPRANAPLGAASVDPNERAGGVCTPASVHQRTNPLEPPRRMLPHFTRSHKTL